MFTLCEAMKWNHLPVAGGLYDQHPKLLDQWETIFRIRGEYERQKQAQEEAKNRKKGGRR